jgi:hypothetical protein
MCENATNAANESACATLDRMNTTKYRVQRFVIADAVRQQFKLGLQCVEQLGVLLEVGLAELGERVDVGFHAHGHTQ